VKKHLETRFDGQKRPGTDRKKIVSHPTVFGCGFHVDVSGIVITSISPSSSRSTSPDGSSSRNLSQPGEQGFTLSPSLLTHLLAAQREHWSSYGTTPNLSFDIPNRERGLVLYRPLGIPPGITEEVARMWSEGGVPTHDDEARFEDLDNEEVIQAEPSAAMEVDDDMDVDMS
jgi:hypothetical protein